MAETMAELNKGSIGPAFKLVNFSGSYQIAGGQQKSFSLSPTGTAPTGYTLMGVASLSVSVQIIQFAFNSSNNTISATVFWGGSTSGQVTVNATATGLYIRNDLL